MSIEDVSEPGEDERSGVTHCTVTTAFEAFRILGASFCTLRGPSYPSHWKLALRQRSHPGRASSHFIRRLRQVMQPVRTRIIFLVFLVSLISQRELTAIDPGDV